MAREKGYVTTLWGRKRRLPDMQLEPYEFDFSNFVIDDFDPLSFNNDYLEVIGNGSYKLEIAINEEGKMVKFPIIVEQLPTTTYKINLNNLQETIKVAKASVAKTMEVPCLTGY